MANQDDKLFLKRFSGIIFGLVLITVLIIVIANFSKQDQRESDNPSRAALADERTRPVGAVRTEVHDAGSAAAEEMPMEPISAAEAPAESAAVAEPASVDGASVYQQACQVCHASGAAGAPIPDSDAWVQRAEKGLEQLVSNAINGLNAMPPKGGRMDLSDAQVTAAVEYMLSQK